METVYHFLDKVVLLLVVADTRAAWITCELKLAHKSTHLLDRMRFNVNYLHSNTRLIMKGILNNPYI